MLKLLLLLSESSLPSLTVSGVSIEILLKKPRLTNFLFPAAMLPSWLCWRISDLERRGEESSYFTQWDFSLERTVRQLSGPVLSH